MVVRVDFDRHLGVGSAGPVRFAVVGVVGLSAGIWFVLLAAPQQSHGARDLLGPWWSATSALAPWREPRTFARGGLIVVTAVLTLAGAWLTGSWLVARERLRPGAVAAVAALWCVPFALVPPILSKDAYAYLAQGAAAGTGGSPYRSPLAGLGATSPLLSAVDPLYRNQVSPYGPLALRLLQASLWVGRGDGAAALIFLRVVMVLAVAVTAWCGWRLAPPQRRALTVWLLAASPLVLLQLVGGVHLEALLGALLGVALLLHARGSTRLAVVVVVVAAAVKLPAVVALPALLLDARRAGGWIGLGRHLAVGVGTAGALTGLLQPDPFGWVVALKGTLQVWNPISLPSVAALAWATLAGGSPTTWLAELRLLSSATGLLWAGYLCLTAGRRSTAATAGFLLAAVTLTGPVLWPWYVAPAVVCLVLAGGARHVLAATGLAVGAALTALPMPVIQMQRVSAAAEAAVLVSVVGLLARERRRSDKSSLQSGHVQIGGSERRLLS